MSNIVEIHCKDRVEKATIIAFLRHLPDVHKVYKEVEVLEHKGNHLKDEEVRTKVVLVTKHESNTRV
jgi:hypothetical protein